MDHRGPFKLQVSRPPTGKEKVAQLETLPGLVEGIDIEDECLALLTDPRDTITRIYVWSDLEGQHCFSRPTTTTEKGEK